MRKERFGINVLSNEDNKEAVRMMREQAARDLERLKAHTDACALLHGGAKCTCHRRRKPG